MIAYMTNRPCWARRYTSPALVLSWIGPGSTPGGASRPARTVARIAVMISSRTKLSKDRPEIRWMISPKTNQLPET